MDDEVERLTIGVRADTGAFLRDVAEMRAALEGPLAAGADRAGRAIEQTLLRAARTGKLGFEDLKAVALSVLGEIAAVALHNGIGALIGGNGDSSIASVLGGILGLPGRATGGPVAPGRAYMVGERGPELFVPTASGRIEPGAAAGPREVRVAITINAAAGTAPGVLAQSSRQVARAVKAALEG